MPANRAGRHRTEAPSIGDFGPASVRLGGTNAKWSVQVHRKRGYESPGPTTSRDGTNVDGSRKSASNIRPGCADARLHSASKVVSGYHAPAQSSACTTTLPRPPGWSAPHTPANAARWRPG